MQDVAGCRIVVSTVRDQNELVARLNEMFHDLRIVDRRATPSHGYRAVHAIAQVDGKPIEIQVRSQLQHLWAEFSESLADSKGQELKYGKGPILYQDLLLVLSNKILAFETGHPNERSPKLEEEMRLSSVECNVHQCHIWSDHDLPNRL